MMKKSIPNECRGFTLVEIAVVLTIIGVLLGSGLLALDGFIEDARYTQTQKRLEVISNALANYAQTHYQLPCAATPIASAAMLGVATTSCPPAGNLVPGTHVGIVPYVTLGLRQDQARDAYGSFITYIVDSAYASEVQNPAAGTYNTVQNACRINGWMVSSVVGPNRNPDKARFCCSVINIAWGNDLAILRDDTDLSPTNRLHPSRTSMMSNGGINTPLGAASTTATDNQTPAFLLISHGKDRYGAFQVNGTWSRVATSNGTNHLYELQNAFPGPNHLFFSAPYSTNLSSSTGYFDDILLWKTPDQLMSAFGRDSCARP